MDDERKFKNSKGYEDLEKNHGVSAASLTGEIYWILLDGNL